MADGEEPTVDKTVVHERSRGGCAKIISSTYFVPNNALSIYLLACLSVYLFVKEKERLSNN